MSRLEGRKTKTSQKPIRIWSTFSKSLLTTGLMIIITIETAVRTVDILEPLCFLSKDHEHE